MTGAARAGVVYLVGAGPGDPGLMTSRGLELVAAADVVVHDRLIPPEALAGAREDAELLYVGKEPGNASVPQEQIQSLLVDRARAGRSVVRLKGGDPFVFARGGEEAEALAEAGVPFEVVPGVTAGVAAPAYAGVPVTHRDDASAVAFVTGHEDPDKAGGGAAGSGLDYTTLASFPGTLVFYMGVRALPRIAERLIAGGRDPNEPAAVIERGTLPGQRTVTSTLGDVAAASAGAEIRPPAVTVVGPAAARAETIGWLEQRPLHGKRVVVTRARAQASELSAQLAALGAEPIELPTIRIEPRIDSKEVRRAIESVHTYALVCLTSPTGVELFCEAMVEQGRDARALANATVAAIGPGTAAALGELGILPDVVPKRFVAEGLVEALAEIDVYGKPVLLARAAGGRDVLPNALRERGAELDDVALYETVAERPDPDTIERAAEADYITFTSSSTVRNLTEVLPEDIAAGARVVTIGPATSEAARDAGLTVHVEAERHDIDGLIEALLSDASESRG
jgi:uroporphyrinogen III methyltransferase / synthase